MKCSECKYWVDQGHMGNCKRYPVTATKSANDWCGDYVAKDVLRLPVVSVEEVLDNFPTIKRKPGRPAKEAE